MSKSKDDEKRKENDAYSESEQDSDIEPDVDESGDSTHDIPHPGVGVKGSDDEVVVSSARPGIERVPKETGIFTIGDPLDPTTKDAMAKDEAQLYDKAGTCTGTCDHCQRPLNLGRYAVQCTECGVIVHQFCSDNHAIRDHKPLFSTVMIEGTPDPKVFTWKQLRPL